MSPDDIQDIEIRLVLEALRLRYGYDFRQYAPASLRRRVLHCLEACGLASVSGIIPQLLHEGKFLDRLLGVLMISVSTLFRDPPVFRALRERSLPLLKTHPFVNIWSAGCATGEEAYSLAILLREEGLYERARIYATDLNTEALARAEAGLFPGGNLEEFTSNHRASGGRGSLSDHLMITPNGIRVDPELKRNLVFSTHNLVTDGVFAEMHLILCRNVLIYFEEPLRRRVVGLFRESLVRGGELCFGSCEGLEELKLEGNFGIVSREHRIYRKGFGTG